MTAEEILRVECRVLCACFPHLPRIRRIAAVGSLDASIGSRSRDSVRLTETLRYLIKSGVIIDPDFEVDAVNFRENRDFLMEKKQADLVLISYILRDRHYCNIFTAAANGQSQDELNLICTLSPKHHPYRWIDRVRQAGAKMIVTYGGCLEIHAGYFCDPWMHEEPYKELISSPTEECMGGFMKDELKSVYPYRDIDVPVTGLGFCADEDYLKAIRPALNRTTCLSRLARGEEPRLRESSVPPVAGAVLELQGDHIGLERAEQPKRKPERYHGPQHRMNPERRVDNFFKNKGRRHQ